jgi:hypothetical protein
MQSINFRNFTHKFAVILIILNFSSAITAQTTPDGSAPQFLFPDFSLGKVRMLNGNIQKLVLNYNTVSEKMVYEKDNNLYDMVNTEWIDTVFIEDFKYIPVGKVFYEVWVVAPISLFVQYQGELIPPGAVAGYGGTSQVSNTKNMTSVNLSMGYYNLKLPKDYTVKVDQIFWIRKDTSMLNYTNEKQFLKIFPPEGEELKQYIRKQKIKFDKISDQVKLIEHCNEMIKRN